MVDLSIERQGVDYVKVGKEREKKLSGEGARNSASVHQVLSFSAKLWRP